MSHKQTVHESYERWSHMYDTQANPTRDLSTAVLKTLLLPFEQLKLVEAGCGTGGNTVWLARHCQELIGLDFSESMLAIARQKVQAEHVTFVVQDLLDQWPVDPEWADLVLLNLVLEHIERIEDLLQQAKRTMKKGARLLITEYHPDRVKIGSGAEFTGPDSAPVEIINFWHPVEKYKRVADALGLQIEKIQSWRKTLDEGSPVESDVEPLLLSICLRRP